MLRLDDGFVGLHNGIAFDAARGRSTSAISVVTSADGLAWRAAHDAPIVAPTTGWRARFVYACDVRRDPRTGRRHPRSLQRMIPAEATARGVGSLIDGTLKRALPAS